MMEQKLNQSAKYRQWHNQLTKHKVIVNELETVYVHHAQKDQQVLYALLRLDAETGEGIKLNPICFLKGDAVSMLVVLIAEETNEKYVVLVKQPRICNGSFTFEHPAGMIDETDHEPVEVAARELGEETQLQVDPSELIPLFHKPLFSATATSDEALHFFYLERRMPLNEILAMNSKKTGEADENEHTQLYISPFREAHQLVSNIHGVMIHLLYLKTVGDYATLQSL
jgi:ADP-sugar diphosphatase